MSQAAEAHNRSVHFDLDDTRVVQPLTAARPLAPDLDDTVVRAAPPALVEPPPRSGEDRDPSTELPTLGGLDMRVAPATRPAEPRVRARIRGGELLDLSRPVLIGRKPSVPRIRRGPEPRLVTVPSPAKEVSSTHLELRMHGASVVASDMRSTNGTGVVLPGGRSRTLLRGESAVVPAGSVIALGDGVVVDILAMEPAPPAQTTVDQSGARA